MKTWDVPEKRHASTTSMWTGTVHDCAFADTAFIRAKHAAQRDRRIGIKLGALLGEILIFICDSDG